MADKPRMKPPAKVSAQLASDLQVIANTPPPRKGYRPPHGTEYIMVFDEPTDSYGGAMTVPGHPSVNVHAHGRRELYLKAQEAKETGNG